MRVFVPLTHTSITQVESPSLTYASTATSEESNLSAGLAPRSQPGAGILINGKDALSVDAPRRHLLTPDGAQRALQFDLRATPEPRPISPAPSPSPSRQSESRSSSRPGWKAEKIVCAREGASEPDERSVLVRERVRWRRTMLPWRRRGEPGEWGLSKWVVSVGSGSSRGSRQG